MLFTKHAESRLAKEDIMETINRPDIYVCCEPIEKIAAATPEIATTIFNLAELNHALKREGKGYADSATEDYAKFLVGVQVSMCKKRLTCGSKSKSYQYRTPSATPSRKGSA